MAAGRESVVAHHAMWDVHLWTEDNLPNDLPCLPLLPYMDSGAMRSNFLRVDLMERFGGMYLDTDFEIFRSFAPLLEGEEAVVIEGSRRGVYGNFFFALPPASPVMRHMRRRAFSRVREDPAAALTATPRFICGPRALTAAVRDYERSGGNVRVLPPRLIWSLRESSPAGSFPASDAYARHWCERAYPKYQRDDPRWTPRPVSQLPSAVLAALPTE